MKNYDDIIIAEANYLLDHKATVRQAAEYFGRCKSSIHDDMRKRLPHINESLAIEVSHLLATNLAERSTRGGKALANKYANIRRIKNEVR
jgi:putative DeoR family transcriptional regulator (stage III sporulation protein D)